MVKLLRIIKLAVLFASSFIANAVKSRILDTHVICVLSSVFFLVIKHGVRMYVLVEKHHSRSCCVIDFERRELH